VKQKSEGAKSPLSFSPDILDKADTHVKEMMLSNSKTKNNVLADKQISDVEYLSKMGIDMLVDKLNLLQEEYRKHKRTTHKKDIQKLIEAVKGVQQSVADPEVAYKRAIVIVESVLMQEQKQFTRAYLCFGGRSHDDFITKVNDSKKSYFYPRLLADVLNNAYGTASYLRVDGSKHTLSTSNMAKDTAAKIQSAPPEPAKTETAKLKK
jgi:hypothetical protein